jgi:hypothetical protein
MRRHAKPLVVVFGGIGHAEHSGEIRAAFDPSGAGPGFDPPRAAERPRDPSQSVRRNVHGSLYDFDLGIGFHGQDSTAAGTGVQSIRWGGRSGVTSQALGA